MAETNTSSIYNTFTSSADSALTTVSTSANNLMYQITQSAVDVVRKKISDELTKIFGDTNINYKNYISKEDFDAEFIETIQSLALQAGDAFLNGLDTSILAPPDEEALEDAMRYAERSANDMIKVIETSEDKEATLNSFASNMLMSTGVGGNVAGVTSMISLINDTDWNKVGKQGLDFALKAPQIIAEVTKKLVVNVTKKLTIYSTVRLTEIVDPTVFAVALSYYTTHYLTISLKNADDIIRLAMANRDEVFKSTLTTYINNKKAQENIKFNEWLANTKYAIKNVSSYIQNGVEAAKPYIKLGVDPFINITNSFVRVLVDNTISWVDKQADFAITQRDNFIQKYGELAGTKLAEELNKHQEDALKKLTGDAKKESYIVLYTTINAIMSPIQLAIIRVGPLLGKLIKAGAKLGMKMLINQTNKAIEQASKAMLDSINNNQ